jgi:hypothetical protein
MIFDALIVCNKVVKNLDFISRLKEAEVTTRGPPSSGIRLYMKKMWPLSSFAELVSTKFSYDTDGYIFTPVDEPVKMETHETMFKWKPRDKITIDFLVTNKVMCVWDRRHGMVHIQDGAEEHMEGCIVECKYENTMWIPVKIRTDKLHPNNRRTYMRTLINIRENITIEELSRLQN